MVVGAVGAVRGLGGCDDGEEEPGGHGESELDVADRRHGDVALGDESESAHAQVAQTCIFGGTACLHHFGAHIHVDSAVLAGIGSAALASEIWWD